LQQCAIGLQFESVLTEVYTKESGEQVEADSVLMGLQKGGEVGAFKGFEQVK
jgi:hypothetical protein